MQMLQRQHKLRNIKPRAILRKPRLLLQMPKQLAAALKIRNEVQIGISLEAKFQTDEEGGVEGLLEDLALADGVGDLLLGDDLALGEDLHGVDALRVLFADLEDAPEGAAADELEELEVARGGSPPGL